MTSTERRNSSARLASRRRLPQASDRSTTSSVSRKFTMRPCSSSCASCIATRRVGPLSKHGPMQRLCLSKVPNLGAAGLVDIYWVRAACSWFALTSSHVLCSMRLHQAAAAHHKGLACLERGTCGFDLGADVCEELLQVCLLAFELCQSLGAGHGLQVAGVLGNPAAGLTPDHLNLHGRVA